MDEFLKMTWRTRDASELEEKTEFMSPEAYAGLALYAHIEKPFATAERETFHHVKRLVPGRTIESPPAQKNFSFLDEWQQEQCLKGLILSRSGKDPFHYTAAEKLSVQTYNELQSKIIEENVIYLKSVRQTWDSQKRWSLRLKPKLYNYARSQFQKKLNKFLMYPQYYKKVDTLNMSTTDGESEIECKHVINLMEVGTLARFAPPSFKAKCFFKVGNMPSDDPTVTNSKLPVSQDENINKLLPSSNVDVVISSGSLKTIMDPTNINKEWTIPVIIKKIKVPGGSNDQVKNIVYIDNPLPKMNPDILDYSYFCHKMLIRTEFCQFEAFNFPTEDLPIQKEQSELEKKITELEKKFANSEIASDEAGEPPGKQMKMDKKEIYHNASYRLWSLKKQNLLNTLSKNKTKDVNINLLVRSKLDACEKTEQGHLQPVIVRPKLEFQLQYGALIPTEMELSREWTSLFFRPYSTLYRVRIDSSISEAVSVESCTLQKIISQAMQIYGFKPNLRLHSLQKLLENLTEIEEEGNYVLRHTPNNGSFVVLMKQSDEGSNDVFDLHNQIEQYKFVDGSNFVPKAIDVNYILPAHEADNRMPGLFRPFIRKNKGAKNKGKKKKAATKKVTENKPIEL